MPKQASYLATQFRPFFFARYRARSAALTTTSSVGFLSLRSATPILTVTESFTVGFALLFVLVALDRRRRLTSRLTVNSLSSIVLRSASR